MCGQYDDPTFDPALFDAPTPDTEGPLPPLTRVSEEELQRHRAGFDEYIDQLTDPKAFVDGVPYTPAEAEVVRDLIRTAAEDDPGEGNEPRTNCREPFAHEPHRYSIDRDRNTGVEWSWLNCTGKLAGPRFRPCAKPGCGESPARHNQNDPDAVRHEYE